MRETQSVNIKKNSLGIKILKYISFSFSTISKNVIILESYSKKNLRDNLKYDVKI